MNSDKIFDKSQQIFKEVFDDEDLIINAETSAEDIEEWDSLSHIRLIVAHEVQFNIKFTANEIDSCNNISEFHNLISSKLIHNE